MKRFLRTLLTEPLLHFLVLGVGLFALFGFVSPNDVRPRENVIVVDRASLLNFIQFRSKAFEPGIAAARLDAMSAAERRNLVADYIREEVLYREAMSLGMDAHDYAIKRRLIQKMEFVTESITRDSVELTDDQLTSYFEKYRSDYYVEPHVTFTHVFFDSERNGHQWALADARKTLAKLNEERVPFSDSVLHGDRFPYHVNYVERTPEFVASHFDEHLAQKIFDLEPDDELWLGPFESLYGYHLVMLSDKSEGRIPPLHEVRESVIEDARRAAIRKEGDAAIQAIIDTYDIRVMHEHVVDGAVHVAVDH